MNTIPKDYKELAWEQALPGQVTWRHGISDLVPSFVLDPSEHSVMNEIGQRTTVATLLVPEHAPTLIDMNALRVSMPISAVVAAGSETSRRKAAEQLVRIEHSLCELVCGKARLYVRMWDAIYGHMYGSAYSAVRLGNNIHVGYVDGGNIRERMCIEYRDGELRCVMTTRNIADLAIMVLALPYSEAVKTIAECTPAEQNELSKFLENIAKRATWLGSYASERNGGGCGDQGHKTAAQRANSSARKLWCNVLGYGSYVEVHPEDPGTDEQHRKETKS